MKGGEEWNTVVTMVAVNFTLGMVNASLKKTLDGGIDHMIVATYRMAISTVFLAPIAHFWERKTRPKLTLYILCQLFFSALLGASLTQYFLLLGLANASATMACALLSMVPAMTFILAVVFRLEKLRIKSKSGIAKVVGTLVCVGGALCLTLYKGMPLTSSHWHAKGHSAHQAVHPARKSNWALGSISLLVGSILWSSWLLLHAKISKRYPCQYSSTTILSFFGAIQAAVLSLIKARSPAQWILKHKFEIITILYAGVVGQAVCTVGMSWSVKLKGPLSTSTFTPLMLIAASVFDFFVFHGTIYLGSVVGSVFVIIGLYVFLWAKSKDTEELLVKQTQLAERRL